MNQLISELPGLITWLPHTESSGTTINDYSGSGNNGTINGATIVKDVTGGYALDYDKTNDVLNIGAGTFASLNAGTLMAWIRADVNTSDVQYFLGCGSQSGAQEACQFGLGNVAGTGNVLIFVFRTSAGTQLGALNGSTDLTTNAWYHVALTCNGTTTKMFVNGSEETLSLWFGTNPSGKFYNDVGGAPYYSVGGTYNGSTTVSSPFGGMITDVMYFNQALSPELIAQLYRKTYRA